MATNLFTTFQPIRVRASATGSGNRSSDTCPRSSSSSSTAASNRWSPLFDWPSDPDYIESNSSNIADDLQNYPMKLDESEANAKTKAAGSKFAPGGFTEEKARRLRMMTTGTEAFHDHAMYHSAIASRLASDFSRRSDL